MEASDNLSSPVSSVGRLLVHVVEGRNLAAKDENGLSDPYCVVKYGGKKQVSDVVNENLNPKWKKSTFAFAYPNDKDNAILIEVWDKDRLRDDFMGYCLIQEVGNFEGWIPLQARSKGDVVTGDIYVKTTILAVESNDILNESGGNKKKMALKAVMGKVNELRRIDDHQLKQLAEEGKKKLPPEWQSKLDELIQQLEVYKETVTKLKEEYQILLNEKELIVKQFVDEKKELAEKVAKEKIKEITDQIMSKLEEQLGKALDLAAEKAKIAIKDDEMPDFVKRLVDITIDEVMPDIKEEVISQILEKINERLGKLAPIDEGEPPSVCNLYGRFRAWFLYHLIPFDKSIWAKLRDPYRWIILIVSGIPIFGIVQIFYLLLFFLIDKRDEFQLTEYIMRFKGMQFISTGLISTLIGAVQYYICANRTTPNCDVYGPSVDYYVVALFVIQIIFVWAAYLLLPYSEKKGGRRLLYPTEDNEPEYQDTCCGKRYQGRGGRLRHLLYYDTFVFFLLVFYCGMGAFIFHDKFIWEDGFPEWQFKADLYWARVFYGLLSFPFFFFKIPGLTMVLTHARPTAYNRNGKTVPLRIVKKKKQDVGLKQV